MAIFKQELRTLLVSVSDLTDLVGTKIFPHFASNLTARPYIILETTAKDETYAMLGDLYLHKESITLTIVADSYLSAEGISTITRRILSGLQNTGINDIRLVSAILANTSDSIQSAGDDSENQRWIVTQDFEIFYTDTTDAPIAVADIP